MKHVMGSCFGLSLQECRYDIDFLLDNGLHNTVNRERSHKARVVLSQRTVPDRMQFWRLAQ